MPDDPEEDIFDKAETLTGVPEEAGEVVSEKVLPPDHPDLAHEGKYAWAKDAGVEILAEPKEPDNSIVPKTEAKITPGMAPYDGGRDKLEWTKKLKNPVVWNESSDESESNK